MCSKMFGKSSGANSLVSFRVRSCRELFRYLVKVQFTSAGCLNYPCRTPDPDAGRLPLGYGGKSRRRCAVGAGATALLGQRMRTWTEARLDVMRRRSRRSAISAVAGGMHVGSSSIPTHSIPMARRRLTGLRHRPMQARSRSHFQKEAARTGHCIYST
jgi:hypothetical protein